MTVKEMLIAKLKELKADGLTDGMGCGCVLSDLMPCDGMGMDECALTCVAAVGFKDKETGRIMLSPMEDRHGK